MAIWSQKAQDQLKIDREKAKLASMASDLKERLAIMREFRDADCIIYVILPEEPLLSGAYQSDAILRMDIHFYLKFPGAHPLRVKSMAQLRRLSGGLA